MAMTPGEGALHEAFRNYTTTIFSFTSTDQRMPDEEWNEPFFTYLMTKKQFAQAKRICLAQGWPPLEHPGIPIRASFIAHVLKSRGGKDDLDLAQVIEVLISAFNKRSEIYLWDENEQQGIMINASDKLKSIKSKTYYGTAILQATIYDLAPVTAYHATEAKITTVRKNSV